MPDHTALSRRAATLDVPRPGTAGAGAGGKPVQLLMDSNGRMAWQDASGYNRRARVEATMARRKQGIGDELRAHTDERRATEVAVAVHALNRMLELGRPNHIRVA